LYGRRGLLLLRGKRTQKATGFEAGDTLKLRYTMQRGSDAPFDPTIELVVVMETNDPVQRTLAQAILEEAGIPFFVLGQIATLVTDVDGFLKKWVRIQVPRDCEEEARELLEPLLEPAANPGVD
jgi:hypothetical protein